MYLSLAWKNWMLVVEKLRAEFHGKNMETLGMAEKLFLDVDTSTAHEVH
jgi:hypothetical protein